MNKFHDKTSLWVGVGAGGILVAIGTVLVLHCIDMIKYYKKRRIIKIVKTDTHRIIIKE